MTFRLGGVIRTLSLVDFSFATGIDTCEETQIGAFIAFFTKSYKFGPLGYFIEELWDQIATRTSKASQIYKPAHFLLHRLIATSLQQRAKFDKVNESNIPPRYCMISKENANIHFLLPNYLMKKGS